MNANFNITYEPSETATAQTSKSVREAETWRGLRDEGKYTIRQEEFGQKINGYKIRVKNMHSSVDEMT
jgi:hypothetical protein